MEQTYELSTKYYEIVISNPTANPEDATKKGFIDPMKTHEYVDFDANAGTKEEYVAKARGYLRWINLCSKISRFGVCYMNVLQIADGTSLATPSSIKFVMGYQQADAMYYKDKTNTVYEGIDCLKQLIAEVMTTDYEGFASVYTPGVDGIEHGMESDHLFRGTDNVAKLCDTIDDALENITITETHLFESTDEVSGK